MLAAPRHVREKWPPPKTIQTLTIIILPDGLSFAAPVPEPSTWAMIIIGFAGIGFMGLSPLTQKHDGTHGSLIKNST
jgi:PEP-CTERM motif